MLRSKISRKFVAATLLVVFATNTFAPTVAHALTSGPTAPEATSFEPVDTSDMVNTLTGDLTYNVPLVEVPGPEGGYPLSLSYHAGIQPDADASWVGLGWTLNPGSISRDVNGYPDDYTDVQQTRRDYWNGGTTSTFQFGVSIGLAGSPASVSFGLSIANDTYKGFGIGVDASIGIPVGPLALSAGIGINPYGGAYAGFSASIGMGVPVASNMGMGVEGGISITTNFKTVDAGLTAGAGLYYSQNVEGYDKPLTHQLLGASISSNSTKPSLSVGGFTASAGNSRAGNIQTSSSGWGIGIPITPVFGIYLGKRKVRYWSDETVNVHTNGSLHMDFAQPTTGSNSGFEDHAYDTYHLYDNANYNIGNHPDAREALGGTYPDYDYYNVAAQGIGGNIRPYVFTEELYIQNDKFDGNRYVKQWVPPLPNIYNPNHYANPQNIQYRFINDFSNRFLQTQQDFTYTSNWIYPAFDGNPTYGNNDGSYGYTSWRQELAGSKHIEYIENINMLPGTSHYNNSMDKFYEPVAQGFTRRGSTNGGTQLENSFNYQIGGYKVTNESGVTYHYMLPAYAGAEYVYSRTKNDDANFNMLKKDAYYAYAWYLTGVTGPDYVDANNDGIINEGDWGYWVSFEYGKWCDDYIWRNPAEGFQPDLDNGFETQSAGKKELYYLNKIKTATHTAIFEKQLRLDGKGISSTTSNSAYGNYPLYNGGFTSSSKSTLSLNRVMLFANADANSITTTGGAPLSGHYFQNVFDPYDISTTSISKALRIIKLNYDYSLCPLTPNSFDYANVSDKKGKLTLNSITFLGKAGACGIPPVTFNYELEGSDLKSGSINTTSSNTFSGPANLFQAGDILKLTSGGTTYYCAVLLAFSTVYTVRYLSSSSPGSGLSFTATTTKNPPYGKDDHDIWNMYKSDYDASKASYGENTLRATTVTSSRGKDAWSLRSFTSSMGGKIKIEYESDIYRTAVLDQGYKIQMTKKPDPGYYFNSNTDNRFYYTVTNTEMMDLNNLHIGDRFDAVLFWHRYAGTGCTQINQFCVIDTKIKQDCYLEVTDLSQISNGVIGFNFHNVHERIDPYTNSCEYMNSFPGSDPNSCYRMPDIANLRANSKKINIPGGSLRVKSISAVNTTTNQVQKTVYEYNLPDSPTISSGITSFEPSIFDDASFSGFYSSADERKQYKAVLYKYNSQAISYTREMPPPGVMYEYVTMHNEVYNPEDNVTRTVEGKTTYQFEVFNEKMIGIQQIVSSGVIPYPGEPNPSYNTLETRRLSLKNFTTMVGNLKRIIQYDNNGKKISETVNHYLSDDANQSNFANFSTSYASSLGTYNNQGVLKENFTNIRYINNGGGDFGARKAVNSMREEYPSILVDQTKIDYVTNTKAVSQNLAFDFYSGALTKKLYVDVNGNRFVSKSIPAYTKYPQMGLKIAGWANKNMLTQNAETYTYKVDGSNNPIGLIAASVQTWSNGVDVMKPNNSTIQQNDGTISTTIGNVWRPKMNYAWMPEGSTTDGITAIGLFADFDWNNANNPGSQNAGWKKTGEVTLYNIASNMLEASDINGSYGSSRMGYGQTKVLFTAVPAKYAEIAYSGAEDDPVSYVFNSGFALSGSAGSVTTTVAHTGTKSVMIPTGQTDFYYSVPLSKLQVTRDYYASVWLKSSVSAVPNNAGIYYSVNGGAPVYSTINGIPVGGGWNISNLKIPASALSGGDGNLVIGCFNNHGYNVYFDDIRFNPLDASVSSYVYNASGELTDVLDNNNFFTRYEYDGIGRLTKIYRETQNTSIRPVNEYAYNYGVPVVSFSSAAINNQPYVKNDCPSGLQGSTQYISVPAGQFISCISQPDADNAAQLYAQQQANATGTCSCTTGFTPAYGLSFYANYITVSGSSVSFTLVPNYPAGQYSLNLGTINASCAWPTSTRTVPMIIGSTTYNVTITSSGNVSVQVVSGPPPSGGGIGFVGSYDINVNSFYSNAASGYFVKNDCPPGQTGSGVTYSVQQYKYRSIISQADADQQAQNDVNTYGQSYANSTGTCTTPCSFTPQSGMSFYTSTITNNGTTASFNFVFPSPNGSYYGGTLGTISTGCRPSAQRTVIVTDGATSSRQWMVTIQTNGTVSISLYSGSPAGFGPPVVVAGSYNL